MTVVSRKRLKLSEPSRNQQKQIFSYYFSEVSQLISSLNDAMATCTDITLPNGKTYQQPTGLFINNEYVPATGDEFAVTNPA